MEWKWSFGSSYLKSKRQLNSNSGKKYNSNDDVFYNISNNDNNVNDHKFYNNHNLNDNVNDEIFNKEIEKSAYTTALNHDENTWDILNNVHSQNQSLNDFRQVNKREDTDKKMAERDLICQVSMNPYLTTNNYLNDVANRDTFLKPQATNWDREKKKDEN